MHPFFTAVPDTYACPSRTPRVDIAAFAAAMAVSPAAAALLRGGEPLPPPPTTTPVTGAATASAPGAAAAAPAPSAAAAATTMPRCPLLSVRRRLVGAADGGRRWLATHGGAFEGAGEAPPPPPPPPPAPPPAPPPLSITSAVAGVGNGSRQARYSCEETLEEPPFPAAAAVSSPNLVPGDVVVHVAIYAAQAPVVAVEALLLGTSPLSAVRDVLVCPADAVGARGGVSASTAAAAAAAAAITTATEGAATDAATNAAASDVDAAGVDGVPRVAFAPRTGLLVAEGVAYHVRRGERVADDDDAGLSSWLASAAAVAAAGGESDRSVEEEGSGGEDAAAASSSHPPRRRHHQGVRISPVPAEALPLTTFRPRRGMPYLVAHGNGCEHLWVVRDVRTPVGGAGGDPVARDAYPAVIARAPQRLRKCSVCNVAPAAWVTWDDPLADASPCFFCCACYEALHLDSAGVPTVEHLEVHPYIPE
ncbi:hypothetical protein MMPV_000439 [Pyropia vietnamensis]